MSGTDRRIGDIGHIGDRLGASCQAPGPVDEDLTENERLALADIERLLEGRPMSHREIAKRLGIAHGTSQNIETRALAKMRKHGAGWSPW